VFEDVRDPAGAAGQVLVGEGPEHRPPQPGTLGDGSVDIGHRRHAALDQRVGLLPQRRLQPVGHVAGQLLAQPDRLLADGGVEGERASTACSEVFSPGTTSTSGIRCGGLNGCPITTRSGCRGQPRAMTLGSIPDELDASTTSGRAAASSTANSWCLTSSRSGPFSCTKSASATASAGSGVNASRSGDPPAAGVSVGQIAATSDRSRCSAPGDGSVATTSRPWARKCAAQLAPITPVPTTATRWTVTTGSARRRG